MTITGSTRHTGNGGGVAFVLKRAVLWCLVAILLCSTTLRTVRAAANDVVGPETMPPLVIVVTLDTFRADHAGCYGNAAIRTPMLDLLGRRGFTFADVSADVPLTLPSHCSLMTGLPVQDHGVRSNHARLGPGTGLTAATFFAARDYRTAAFIGGFPLLSPFGLDRGFGHYDDRMNKAIGPGTSMLERRADDVIAATLLWLEASLRTAPRHFIWVHCYDPHHPYEAPRPWSGMTSDEYEAEIMFTDNALSPLIHFVSQSNRRGQDVRFLIIGDHGEARGDHGEFTHGLFLYQATLHVPCILWQANGEKTGISTEFSTISDMYSLIVGGTAVSTGTSCGNGFTQNAAANRHRYLETIFPYEKYRWHIGQGVRRGQWKFLAGPIPELYDLETDPLERKNVYYHFPDVAEELRTLFEQESRRLGTSKDTAVPLDDAARRNLGSLGYLGGMVGSPLPANSVSLPDGKSRRGCLPDIENGERLSLHGQYAEAIPVLERARSCDPSNPDVLNNLGIAYQAARRLADAEEALHTAVRLAPDNARFLNNLGSILKRSGKTHEAIACYRKAFVLDPAFSAAGLNLAIAEFEQGNMTRACDLLRQVLVQDPDVKEALSLRSRMACPPE